MKNKRLSIALKKAYSEGRRTPNFKGQKRPEHSKAMKKLYKSGYVSPMKGRKPTKKQLEGLKKGRAWNKGTKGVMKSHRKGLTLKQEYGIKKAKQIRIKMSKKRKQLFKEGKLRDSRIYLKGELSPTYGRKLTEETKNKLKEVHKEMWKNPEYVEKCIKGFNLKPTRPEKVVMKIIKDLNIPFEYNGDFSKKIVVGGRIPDFVDVNRKKIIEVFGEYWHDKKLNKSLSNRRGEKRTVEDYKKQGYLCLVIWQKELKKISEVIKKVEEFNS